MMGGQHPEMDFSKTKICWKNFASCNYAGTTICTVDENPIEVHNWMGNQYDGKIMRDVTSKQLQSKQDFDIL